MNQLKSIYNSPFKDSHSYPIHTCFPITASNAVPHEEREFEIQNVQKWAKSKENPNSNTTQTKICVLSWNGLFEGINRLQSYEFTGRCSHPLFLTIDLCCGPFDLYIVKMQWSSTNDDILIFIFGIWYLVRTTLDNFYFLSINTFFRNIWIPMSIKTIDDTTMTTTTTLMKDIF